MAEISARDVMRRYLQDAIAAEENFEHQIRDFIHDAKEYPDIEQVFGQHLEETQGQVYWLKDRLDALGGAASGMKSFLAQLFGGVPKMAQIGHAEEEKVTQNLVAAYAMECSEIAMYDALANAAAAAGDAETEKLARAIQKEERRAAEMVGKFIAPCAREAFMRVTAADRAVPAYPGTAAEATAPPPYPGTTVAGASADRAAASTSDAERAEAVRAEPAYPGTTTSTIERD